MTAGIATWWRERTQREQRLLLAMFALLALVLGWLLIIRPLSDALDTAQRRHAEAVTALSDARSRAEAARRLQGERTAAAPLPLDSFIGRTSTEAGFTGARITAQGPARASITVDAARPQAFFTWVRLMERSGLAVDSLRARANSDRTLMVEAAFRARSG
jgi:general secretion pathway protein M